MRTTAHEWLARYRSEGLSGLIDRPSVARVRPHALPSAWINLIRTLRQARHAAHSITRQLHLARSTLSRLGWGLSQLTKPPLIVRYERELPGELVYLDIWGALTRPATASAASGYGIRLRRALTTMARRTALARLRRFASSALL